MAILFAPFFRATDQQNAPIAGAFATFYKTGTSTLQPIWSEVTLSIALSNPIQADGNGVFPAIWLDDSLPLYKVIFQYPDVNNPAVPGSIIAGPNGTIDPYNATLSVNALGNLLFPLTAAEIAAAIVPSSFLFSPALGVDVRRFGIVGDGAADDTAAMLRAIQTGQPLDIGNLSIRITSRLSFNKNSQYVYGRGGQFLFDGPFTDRLMSITANDVRFHGVKFNGNAKQVLGCLIYCASNAARPKFLNCRFTNINGTHVSGVQNTSSNSQYAVMISPYGVEGFDFADCIFDEIYNDNSGLNAVPQAIGAGFCGGIFFLTEDFAQPVTPQGVFTSGQIGNCLFKNIKTILAAGLSIANSVDFQDAEGIRFYGDAGAQTSLLVSVHDCVFVDCSKRAIKGSVAVGVKVSQITVLATSALQYPMVTAIKVDGNDFQLRGMNVYSPTSAPIRQVIQTHDGRNLLVDGVYAERCGQFWSMSPTSTAVVTSGWRVSNLRCASITNSGGSGIGFGITSDTLPDHFEDCVFENVDFECDSSIHSMLGGSFVATTNRMEVVLKNWKIVNGDLKIAGFGYLLQDLYQEITDTAYVNSITGRCLLEAGVSTGSAPTRESIVHGYTLNIKAITSGYLATARPFALIYGDRTKVSQLRLTIPAGYDPTFAHWQIDGADFTVDDFEYSGAGYGYVNNFSVATKRRMTIDGARRIGGAASTSPFFYLYLSQDCAVANIVDYCLTTASSVVVQSGTVTGGRTYAYVLDGIWSLSSNTNVVADGGSLAHIANMQKF